MNKYTIPTITALVLHSSIFLVQFKTKPQQQPIKVTITGDSEGESKNQNKVNNLIPKGNEGKPGQKCQSRYGGIGVLTVGQYVDSVTDGYSGQIAGIRAGDLLVTPQTDLRGVPGTIAHVVILRVDKVLTFDIRREWICEVN